jgi:hypothetical protein
VDDYTISSHFLQNQFRQNALTLRTKNIFMETTIRINTDLLTPEIMEGIKKMFPHKTVDITIQSADDTEYILENPAFANELKERMETYQTKKESILLKPEDLV